MALRADTARHIITTVTVLVFSAAAIGTAMRYQERTGPIQMPANVELPAREAIPASPAAAAPPAGYIDATRGSGADIVAKLEGTLAVNEATGWASREGGAPVNANAGSAEWWGKPTASLTPTSRRSSRAGGGGGSVGGPGGGYTVAGAVSGNGGNGSNSANALNGPNTERPASGNGGGNSGGSSGGPSGAAPPVFNNHAPSVGDLVDDSVAGLSDVAAPGGGGGGVTPGGLSATPEPTSLLLMATGLAGVLGAARRRRRQARRG